MLNDKKKLLIITALPFRKQGNQSLIRFVDMFLNRGFFVKLVTTGVDSKGENCLNNKNFQLIKKIRKKNKKNVVADSSKSAGNFYKTIKSDDIIPIYGKHTLARAIKRWFRFAALFFNNICMFLCLFKYARGYKVIVSYEVAYSFAVKLYCLLMRKIQITKYQGTPLAITKSFLERAIFYPEYYFFLLQGNFCFMVNDGTHGDVFLKNKKDLYFLPHGVKNNSDDSCVNVELKKLILDNRGKLIISNIASGARWKRVDRFIRILSKLDDDVKSKVIAFSTACGADSQMLKELADDLNVGNIVFLQGLNHQDCNYLIRQSNLVISVNEVSNLGNPVLEAIYNRVGVISIDDGSTNDVLNENTDGWLFKLDASFDADVAKKIVELVYNSSALNNIKANKNNIVLALEEAQQNEFHAIKHFIDP